MSISSDGTGSGEHGSGSGGEGGFVPPTTGDLDAILDQYEFLDLLGRGGMGAVYKARQKSLDRLVAIKILPPQLATDEEEQGFHFEERFQREAKAMAKLSHPHIIGVYDFGQAKDGQFYFVMEYVEGTDLHALIKTGELTIAHVAGWMSQICEALQYAHGRGIVHRDIKPANIMITREGEVKIADFGLAMLTGGGEVVETKLTMVNMTMGTPDYVAPEALEIGVEVDHRADLYAVGVMLYEMLTGKVPRGAWKPPSTQIPGLDERYDRLIERAMDADREGRYQHANEISATIYEITTTPARPTAPVRPRLAMGTTAPVRPSTGSSAAVARGNTRPVASPHKAKTSAMASRPSTSHAASKSPVALIASIVGGSVAVGLIVFFAFKPDAPPPIPKPAATPLALVGTTPDDTASRPQAITTPPARAAMPEPVVADSPSLPSLSPEEPLSHGGHRYLLVKDRVPTWSQSKTRAEEMGGHLAVIGSREEQTWIATTFGGQLEPGSIFWLGGTNDGKPGEWRWLTGEPFAFAGWAPNEPQNSPGETALAFICKPGSDRGWADFKDSGIGLTDRRGGFLVEWSDDAATPVKTPAMTSVPTSPTGTEVPADPPAVAVSESGKWIDVIPLIKLPEDFSQTNPPQPDTDWRIENGALTATRPGTSAIVSPQITLPDSYDLSLRVKSATPSGIVAVQVPVGASRHVTVMLKLIRPGHDLTGLEVVADKNVVQGSPVVRPTLLKDDVEHLVEIAVRRGAAACSVDLKIDGKGVLNWSGPEEDLSLYPTWQRMKPGRLGLSAANVKITWREVRWRPAGVGTPPSPTTPAPVPLTATMPTDPRLAQLEAGFKARLDTAAEQPYLTALDTLNRSYLANGLARARAAAQQKGLLDEVTALDAEKARVEAGEPLPAADLDTLPAALKTLRATYRTALAKQTADRAANAEPVYDLYLGALDAYIAELTKGNQIEKAVQVKALRDQTAGQKTALTETATTLIAASNPPGPPAPQKAPDAPLPALPIPTEALSPPARAEHTEPLIGWLRQLDKHRFGFADGSRRVIANSGNPVEFPMGAKLWMIDNGQTTNGPEFNFAWTEGQTELEELLLSNYNNVRLDSLLPLRGMKKLRRLFINPPPPVITDEKMSLWPPLPELKEVAITGQFGSAGLRVICERCPKLESVTVKHARLTATNSLQPLRQLKNLKSLSFDNIQLAPSECAALTSLTSLERLALTTFPAPEIKYAEFVNLKFLNLTNARIGDTGVADVAACQQITHLELAGNNLSDEALPSLSGLTSLIKLNLAGNPQLTGGTLNSLTGLKTLEELSLSDNPKIGDSAITALVSIRTLRRLWTGRTGVTDVGLQALCNAHRELTDLSLPGPVTDAGIPALKRLDRLKNLNVKDCNITNASLSTFKDLKSLKELTLPGSRVSPGAVSDLKKALPGCNVKVE
jgi:serine/threonine protein kinase/Leucine-rich repeat (LRR) protein